MNDTITLDQMRSTLLPLDDVRERLASTEPLERFDVNDGAAIHFELTPGWFDGESRNDIDTGAAVMSINGTERPMTQEALLMATANIGLPAAYVRKTPAALIEAHLNHWYSSGNLPKAYSALAVGGNIAAFTRPTVVPFSNLELLDSAVQGIRNTYGNDAEVLADYKMHHSLARTDIRLIIPDSERTIVGGGMADVPAGQADLWSSGIHLTNSLIGRKQTEIEAYMFRWWCTNGCITHLNDVGTWSRRSNGQDADVYVWAQEAVDEVLGGMEERFEAVQALTALDVTGNVASVAREIFEEYDVPVSQRQSITDLLLDSESLTMYTVMNAITQVANTVDSIRADRLMRIGGDVPTSTFDTLKARIWAEGHLADPEAINPYAIRPVVL